MRNMRKKKRDISIKRIKRLNRRGRMRVMMV